MKAYVIAYAGLAAAAPFGGVPIALDKRQGCKYGFVFARGSTEPAPIGILIGPSLKTALQRELPGLQTFPVGYAASIGTNVSLDRTDDASKKAGVAAFQKAAGCQVIVAAGYSQGAAVMHNVVGTVNGKKSQLDAGLKSKIAGVALFGDTRNQQDSGHIKDFPSERSKVWCNASDGVCGGQLLVNAGHLSYSNSQISEAAKYLGNLAKSFKGGDAGSSSGGEEAPAKSPKKSGKGKAKSSEHEGMDMGSSSGGDETTAKAPKKSSKGKAKGSEHEGMDMGTETKNHRVMDEAIVEDEAGLPLSS